MMRYWKIDNLGYWATCWIPQAHIVVIDAAKVIDWLEGTTTWDRKDVRR